MNVFVEQLKAIKTTMSRVVPEEFAMLSWHCGTTSCVCGHQAISGDLTLFSRTKEIVTMLPAYPDSLAIAVSSDLEQACVDELGNNKMSKSVWASHKEDRLRHALNSYRLTLEQLEHPHLNTDSSPKDVVSYLEMLIGELS